MTYSNLLAARQIRAARALLDWSQDDLSAAAGVSVATIRKLELGQVSRGATVRRIRDALEENGLEFLEPDGVRHSPEMIRTYTGPEGAIDFLSDVLQTIKKKTSEIDIICRSGSLLEFAASAEQECFDKFAEIKKISKLPIKCLLSFDEPSPVTAALCECRVLSRHFVDPASLYIYGDKFAVFDTGPIPKVIIIQSQTIARDMRRQFMSMWEKATGIKLSADVSSDAQNARDNDI